jgi:hypothetical protein
LHTSPVFGVRDAGALLAPCISKCVVAVGELASV